MEHQGRNKNLVIAILVLFVSTGAIRIACGMGSCFCIEEVSCPPLADVHEVKQHNHNEESDLSKPHRGNEDHHTKSDSEDKGGCCPTQKCCDSISQIYLYKKAGEFSLIDLGQKELKVFVSNELWTAYSTYLLNTNHWIKWIRLKAPPFKNINIRIFIQSFLN